MRRRRKRFALQTLSFFVHIFPLKSLSVHSGLEDLSMDLTAFERRAQNKYIQNEKDEQEEENFRFFLRLAFYFFFESV